MQCHSTFLYKCYSNSNNNTSWSRNVKRFFPFWFLHRYSHLWLASHLQKRAETTDCDPCCTCDKDERSKMEPFCISSCSSFLFRLVLKIISVSNAVCQRRFFSLSKTWRHKLGFVLKDQPTTTNYNRTEKWRQVCGDMEASKILCIQEKASSWIKWGFPNGKNEQTTRIGGKSSNVLSLLCSRCLASPLRFSSILVVFFMSQIVSWELKAAIKNKGKKAELVARTKKIIKAPFLQQTTHFLLCCW